jgi:hypothetical protein
MNDRNKIATSLIIREVGDPDGFILVFLPFILIAAFVGFYIGLHSIEHLLGIFFLGFLMTKIDHYRRSLAVADELLSMRKNGEVIIKSNLVNDFVLSGVVSIGKYFVKRTIVIPNKTLFVYWNLGMD